MVLFTIRTRSTRLSANGSSWVGQLLVVLVGLPVLLAGLFEFGVPLLGRLWNG